MTWTLTWTLDLDFDCDSLHEHPIMTSLSCLMSQHYCRISLVFTSSIHPCWACLWVESGYYIILIFELCCPQHFTITLSLRWLVTKARKLWHLIQVILWNFSLLMTRWMINDFHLSDDILIQDSNDDVDRSPADDIDLFANFNKLANNQKRFLFYYWRVRY